MRYFTYHVGDIVQARNPQLIFCGHTGDGEDGGAIDSDTSNANPLLQNLEPDDQVDTTTGM